MNSLNSNEQKNEFYLEKLNLNYDDESQKNVDNKRDFETKMHLLESLNLNYNDEPKEKIKKKGDYETKMDSHFKNLEVHLEKMKKITNIQAPLILVDVNLSPHQMFYDNKSKNDENIKQIPKYNNINQIKLEQKKNEIEFMLNKKEELRKKEEDLKIKEEQLKRRSKIIEEREERLKKLSMEKEIIERNDFHGDKENYQKISFKCNQRPSSTRNKINNLRYYNGNKGMLLNNNNINKLQNNNSKKDFLYLNTNSKLSQDNQVNNNKFSDFNKNRFDMNNNAKINNFLGNSDFNNRNNNFINNMNNYINNNNNNISNSINNINNINNLYQNYLVLNSMMTNFMSQCINSSNLYKGYFRPNENENKNIEVNGGNERELKSESYELFKEYTVLEKKVIFRNIRYEDIDISVPDNAKVEDLLLKYVDEIDYDHKFIYNYKIYFLFNGKKIKKSDFNKTIEELNIENNSVILVVIDNI